MVEVLGPNGEPHVVVIDLADRRLGGTRRLMSSGVSIDMSIAKELGDQSSDDAFSSVTSDLSDAVSGKFV